MKSSQLLCNSSLCQAFREYLVSHPECLNWSNGWRCDACGVHLLFVFVPWSRRSTDGVKNKPNVAAQPSACGRRACFFFFWICSFASTSLGPPHERISTSGWLPCLRGVAFMTAVTDAPCNCVCCASIFRVRKLRRFAVSCRNWHGP